MDEAPALCPGLEWYLVAFFDLTSTRAIGFGGLGPIPWTAISAYATRHGVGQDQFEFLVHHVRKMDEAYLKWVKENHKDDKPGRPVREDDDPESPGRD